MLNMHNAEKIDKQKNMSKFNHHNMMMESLEVLKNVGGIMGNLHN